MDFDFGMFGYSVSDYISGLIKAHRIENPPIYSGIVNESETGAQTVYVLGLTRDDLINLGYRSIDDLHILHSMNTAKTIEVLYLEGSPDVLGVLVTPNLINILENDKSLNYLLDEEDPVWKLYKLESDEFAVTDDDYFELVLDDDGDPVYFDVKESAYFFEDYFKEGNGVSVLEFLNS